MPANNTDIDAPPERSAPDRPGTTERSVLAETTRVLGDPGAYETRTQGRITDRWPDWLDGMVLIDEPDCTTLIRCPALDQAALHGLLAKVRDLGLPLISVTQTHDASLTERTDR